MMLTMTAEEEWRLRWQISRLRTMVAMTTTMVAIDYGNMVTAVVLAMYIMLKARVPMLLVRLRRCRWGVHEGPMRGRRLHKAFLRYHDANNWPLLREALKAMGRADLIGNGKHHLIPTFQPATDGSYQSARRKNSTPSAPVRGRLLTQHTGLPPRQTGAERPAVKSGTVGKVGGKRGPR